MKEMKKNNQPLIEDTPLYVITNSDDNLIIGKCNKKASNSTEEPQVCKLTDFFTNNFSFDFDKITVLHLENCDIDSLPREFQKLKLKQLVLSHNNLREVPSCLYSGLETLQFIDLSYNFIKTFDIEPACSNKVVTLKLANNAIKNFPHWIMNFPCSELNEVDYSNNYLTSLTLAPRLELKKLIMQNSQLRDADFEFLKNLKSLEFLDISNKSGKNENEFKDINKLFVRPKWKNFKVLKVDNLTISIVPNELFWISSITELHLSNCYLSWIPQEIQYLINLQVLDVANNTICSLPKELAELENLLVVRAHFNYISVIPHFVKDLEILDLYHNGLEIFPDLVTQVKFIDLEQNYFETYQYDIYQTKKKQLRQMFDYERIDGPQMTEPEGDSDDDDDITLTTDEYTDNENNEFYDENLENERWDNEDEKPSNICIFRNPEITPSDDEWNGKEEIKEKQKSGVYKPWFDVNEEWIFSDVD